MRNEVFLTSIEAREAVRLDFLSYAPQTRLYARVLPILAGRSANDVASREVLLKLLEKHEFSLGELGELCSLVFGTRVRPGEEEGSPGLWVDTGLEHFACTRCGRCCLELDFHRDCTGDDVRRWERAGRDDILAWVGREKDESGRTRYRIWRYPDTPYYTEACPWLRRVPGDTAFVCSIQDVKPDICRSYPGTAKHGRMTGCPGVGRD